MKKLVLLLIIGSLFVSCKKERTIHITAKNAATGEGYAGLGFVLRETKGYVTSTGEVQKKVYEGTLNAQGEAVFDYKLKNNRSYVLTTLVPEEELCYINNTSYTLSNLDDNYKFDFLFAGCASLKLNIHNINCQGPADSMRFRSRYNYENQWQSWTTYRTGCYNFDSPDYFEVSQGKRMYEWEVIRNGNKTTFSGNVILDKGEYGIFEMNY
jgi:hypothetical protein